MTLEYERPSRLYMRELRAVARSAQALRDHLPKVNRLPEGFPRLPVETHCGALIKLPGGTAEGSIATLLTADAELNRVRQRYIPAAASEDEDEAEAPPVERDGDLDLRFKSLLADIRSAIEHYKRESGEPIETDIAPEIALLPGVDIGAEAAERDAAVAETAIAAASETLTGNAVKRSAAVEKVEMVMTDASAQAASARGVLAAENPQPATLDKLGLYMDKTAEVLSETGRLLQLGSDIADDAIETWQEIKTQILKSIPALVRTAGGGLRRVADTIRRHRAATENGESKAADPPFDLVEAYRLILDGKAPPASWRPHIRELRFDFADWKENGDGFPEALSPLVKRAEALDNLAPLKGLTGLQWLLLSDTGVADVSALKGLTGLRWLSLSDTGVADVSALSGLTGLQTLLLSNTGVADVSPLSGLTELRNLWIDDDVDVTPLANLTHLTINGGKRGAAKKPVRPGQAGRRRPPQT